MAKHIVLLPVLITYTLNMVVDLERQDFETVAATCSNNIYTLSTRIRQTKKLAAKVERDPVLNRSSERLSKDMVAIGEKCSETADIIQDLNKWPADLLSNSQKNQLSDLNSSFDVVLKDIHGLQKNATQVARKVATASGAAANIQTGSSSVASENTPLLQQLVSVDLTIHNDLIEDREQEISEIQRGMLEINSIFKDLGVLVAEQGANLDTVEENISDMARNTNEASNQLTKAENYQKSRGKWSCIALLFLLFITIIVAISIFA